MASRPGGLPPSPWQAESITRPLSYAIDCWSWTKWPLQLPPLLRSSATQAHVARPYNGKIMRRNYTRVKEHDTHRASKKMYSAQSYVEDVLRTERRRRWTTHKALKEMYYAQNVEDVQRTERWRSLTTHRALKKMYNAQSVEEDVQRTERWRRWTVDTIQYNSSVLVGNFLSGSSK